MLFNGIGGGPESTVLGWVDGVQQMTSAHWSSPEYPVQEPLAIVDAIAVIAVDPHRLAARILGDEVIAAHVGAVPPARLNPPRPVWLLAEPEPIGHRLEAQPWVLRDGPERIESGWWDGADVRRDYFIAENPRGETVWIYRDHRYGTDDGEWFLHGLFA